MTSMLPFFVFFKFSLNQESFLKKKRVKSLQILNLHFFFLLTPFDQNPQPPCLSLGFPLLDSHSEALPFGLLVFLWLMHFE
ncbi:unnamed protein product [Citrullus colocynthis]|uniref:Uncharacterized protein n=1 Tax=Citrullus colocynthis TaxID=252529 RepID=A0ABP0XX68_9ROSI